MGKNNGEQGSSFQPLLWLSGPLGLQMRERAVCLLSVSLEQGGKEWREMRSIPKVPDSTAEQV